MPRIGGKEMRAWLDYDSKKHWTIHIEPEREPDGEIEMCALEYLASRPENQVKILITRLGLFERKEVKK